MPLANLNFWIDSFYIMEGPTIIECIGITVYLFINAF